MVVVLYQLVTLVYIFECCEKKDLVYHSLESWFDKERTEREGREGRRERRGREGRRERGGRKGEGERERKGEGERGRKGKGERGGGKGGRRKREGRGGEREGDGCTCIRHIRMTTGNGTLSLVSRILSTVQSLLFPMFINL